MILSQCKFNTSEVTSQNLNKTMRSRKNVKTYWLIQHIYPNLYTLEGTQTLTTSSHIQKWSNQLGTSLSMGRGAFVPGTKVGSLAGIRSLTASLPSKKWIVGRGIRRDLLKGPFGWEMLNFKFSKVRLLNDDSKKVHGQSGIQFKYSRNSLLQKLEHQISRLEICKNSADAPEPWRKKSPNIQKVRFALCVSLD